jgi:hypothetical protein
MKTKISILAIIIMAFGIMAASPAPINNHPASKLSPANGVFGSLRSHKQARGIEVCWSFTGNAAGFTLMRTYEDPTDPYAFWETIDGVAGTMGANNGTASNGSGSYKAHDSDVAPGFLSYKVVASMPDGSTVVSNVSTIQIR